MTPDQKAALQVRRRLFKLETLGKVKRVPSGYAVMIVWQPVDEVAS